jgi:hypothetical protein
LKATVLLQLSSTPTRKPTLKPTSTPELNQTPSATPPPTNDANKLTPVEVIEQQDKWLNKTITVQGIAGTLWLTCTEEACDPDYPCCNICSGSLALYPDVGAFTQSPNEGPYSYQSDGPAIGLEFPNGGGCTGNDCEVTCEPLQLGKRYTVTGLLLECSGIFPWCVVEVENYEHE